MINERESIAVSQIFNMTVSNTKTTEIIKRLKLNGYKTKTGKDFTTTSIFGIIKNEKYKGLFSYGKNKRVKINGVYKDIEKLKSILL